MKKYPAKIIFFLILILSEDVFPGNAQLFLKRDYHFSFKSDIEDQNLITRNFIKQRDTIRYRKVSARDYRKGLSGENLRIVLVLNRIDSEKLKRIDSLIIPEQAFSDIMDYAPFPEHVKFLDSIEKFIFISNPIQAFGVYENGVLVRWGPVSTGKRSTPTLPGLYHTNWKSKRQISTIDPEWIMEWYFNIENRLGISMHKYSLPGYPASHSCIRMLEEDAFWIYGWADQWHLDKKDRIISYGTPVIVTGKYDFSRRPPWKNLSINYMATLISANKMEEEIRPYFSLIMERELKRRKR